MTVAATARKKIFVGNDVATEFPFSFKVFGASSVAVILTDASGIETPLTAGDYDLFVNADQNNNPGGRCEYPGFGSGRGVLAAGEKLTILTETPRTQETRLTNTGGFFPRSIEDRFDYLTVLIQENAERIARTIYTRADDEANLELPALSSLAGKYLAFDPSGKPIGLNNTSFAFDAYSWNAENFGASADTGTASERRLALQSAIDATAGVAELFIPAGEWVIDRALQWRSGSRIRGAGIDKTVIKLSDDALEDSNVLEPVAKDSSVMDWFIADITLDGNFARETVAGVGTDRPGASCLPTMGASYGVIERVKAKDAVLHGIDICAGGELENGRRYYVAPSNEAANYYPSNASQFVTVRDCVSENAGDDAITSHFCQHIWIDRCVGRDASHRHPTSGACNGIEIDDGSRDVWVTNCYAYNASRGFAAKTHPPKPGPLRVYFLDCVAEQCNTGFYIHKSGDSTIGGDVFVVNPVVRNPALEVPQGDAPLTGINVVNVPNVFIINPLIHAPDDVALPLDHGIIMSTSAGVVKIMGGHIKNWPKNESAAQFNSAIHATGTVDQFYIDGMLLENCGWRGITTAKNNGGPIRIRNVHCIGENIAGSVALLLASDPSAYDLEVSGFSSEGFDLQTMYGTHESAAGHDLLRRRPVYLTNNVRVQNTNYTFALEDVGNIVAGSTGDDPIYTVPLHADVPMPPGATIYISRTSSGTTSIVPAAGVTIVVAGTTTSTTAGVSIGGGKFNLIKLTKLHAPNLWLVEGADITVLP